MGHDLLFSKRILMQWSFLMSTGGALFNFTCLDFRLELRITVEENWRITRCWFRRNIPFLVFLDVQKNTRAQFYFLGTFHFSRKNDELEKMGGQVWFLVVAQAVQVWDAIYRVELDFVNCLKMVQNNEIKMTYLIVVVFFKRFYTYQQSKLKNRLKSCPRNTQNALEHKVSSIFLCFGPFSSDLRNRIQLSYKVL